MYVYEVGKPYSNTRSSWPEVVEYNYLDGQHVLRMFLNGLGASDVDGVARGTIRFGLVVDPPVIMLSYRFDEAIPWSDAPFSIHMVPEDRRQMPPELQPGERAVMTIMLIEARSGIVKALRVIGLGESFSRRLHQAIIEQATAPFDQVAYDAKLETMYRNYSSKQLFSRAVARMEVVRGSDTAAN